ncbi:hypothetical protein DVJ83_07540 [Deinococcus wulumuqiensis]|uniref:Uncharacterized protein n=1 Tax=Deinococcus wulumuqiensis TaxID=980427 RepID=A0A345IH65_9DEIO|nr:hypothetical protein DVJ83_07540 [Deinococcus wulumuqiensis]
MRAESGKDSVFSRLALLRNLPYTDSASFLHSRESAACASISRNPYFFLLASALLRSFASRIESETTRFNRNPYYR